MNAVDVEREFWKLCQFADAADTVDRGGPDVEPFLIDILEFAKAHLDQRDTLVRCFSGLVDGSRNYSQWIVLFCMRELRWPEVQEAANRRFELAGGERAPRLMNWISDVNWVYDDSPWEDAVFFRYFWDKEHPGERWPGKYVF
jgi:hypothetical protein